MIQEHKSHTSIYPMQRKVEMITKTQMGPMKSHNQSTFPQSGNQFAPIPPLML